MGIELWQDHSRAASMMASCFGALCCAHPVLGAARTPAVSVTVAVHPFLLHKQTVTKRSVPVWIRPKYTSALSVHVGRRNTSTFPARRRFVCRAAAEDDDEEIPDEVWEAEAKSAPARKFRLGVYTFVGLGATLLAAGRISALTETRTGPMGEVMQPSVI